MPRSAPSANLQIPAFRSIPGPLPFCPTHTAALLRQPRSHTAAPFFSPADRPAVCRAKAKDAEQSKTKSPLTQWYPNITGFPFPIGPIFVRDTFRYEIERGTIWTFEQAQTLTSTKVTVNIRMTVIKLASGGLWVHAPIAPTQECIRLISQLNCPVEYIILPTFAYEHKVFVGPFSRRFPKAKVYVAPMQWSFPIPLPNQALGIFPEGELKTNDKSTPWAGEIEQKVLSCFIGAGAYTEVAFYHKRTGTLLVTDAVILVPENAPDVVRRDSLLKSGDSNLLVKFLAGPKEADRGTQAARTRLERGRRTTLDAQLALGWRRNVLLILYFSPANLIDPSDGFQAIAGRLMVPPVVQKLVFSKVPKLVRLWVDSICADWGFRQIVPCHFQAPIKATPRDLRIAFSFAYPQEPVPEPRPGLFSWFSGRAGSQQQDIPVEYPQDDMRALNRLNGVLQGAGIVYKEGKVN